MISSLFFDNEASGCREVWQQGEQVDSFTKAEVATIHKETKGRCPEFGRYKVDPRSLYQGTGTVYAAQRDPVTGKVQAGEEIGTAYGVRLAEEGK